MHDADWDLYRYLVQHDGFFHLEDLNELEQWLRAWRSSIEVRYANAIRDPDIAGVRGALRRMVLDDKL